MRTLHQLTATIDTTHPLPTEDGAHVTGKVEVVTECDPSGWTRTLCRTVSEHAWHPIAGSSAHLPDPAELPFHHAAVISRILNTPAADDVSADRVSFYFCDDLDTTPSAVR